MSIDLTTLNEQQRKAVTHEGSHLLVLAGAGSGKTRVLTFRAAYLLEEKKAEPQEMLLLTFTNKAAKEMKERIMALTSHMPYFAGTFHSFAVKLLRVEGKHLGLSDHFVIYDTDDQKDLIKTILDDQNINPDSYNPNALLAQIGEAKNEMMSPTEYAAIARGEFQEVAARVYALYEEYLKKAQALDFDDLLIKSVQLLSDHKEVRDRWQNRLKYVFVDEWQDTNKIQYKLVKLLVGTKGFVTAVGDASQSIYGWRGADYRNVNYITRDYPNITVINMEQNYRSTQTILTAANAIISKNTSHPILDLWTENAQGERIKLYKAESGLTEASFVVKKIKELVKTGYTYQDVAVLYRTNSQSRVIEESLLHDGIPYTLVGGTKFYERAEIRDVLCYLRLLTNPSDTVSRARAEKIGKKRLAAFEEYQKKADITKSTITLLDDVIRVTTYLDKFARDSEENQSRLENIKELRSVASEFPIILEFLENVALVEAQETKHADDQNAVTLMTLHSAKGLEFPVVFMVGMEEGLFPHSRALWDTNQLEEERRLAYVGITRAKEVLFLTYADRRLYFGQRSSNPPSRFLIDLPQKLVDASENFTRVKPSYDFENEGY
ncbi:UvrD-helicase domain-containing protein [Candidatus Woesebacteria bacterium]|jgi:DNA helicase-2/ATP-dependent DNA helicase PcrA|nr:UvrD-helicase domain-containing protein [Candidatus Woesebacteria bacterium]